MAAKRSTPTNRPGKAIKRPESSAPRSPWRSILLALTLVPMLIGVLLIGAWAFDYNLLNSPENQITVGTLFLLFSFAASNAIQQKWQLAAGWALLLVADWLLLTWPDLRFQIPAFILGAAGLGLIGIHYFQVLRMQNRR